MIYNKQPNYKYLVGLDLDDRFCQISYINRKRLQAGTDPHTFSRVAGEEVYNIPMPAEGLFGRALEGETRPLADFVRSCIRMITPEVPEEEIDLLTITCEEMDQAVRDMLAQLLEEMGVSFHEVRFESHLQSFYAYLLMTEDEQRKSAALLLDGRTTGQLKISRFSTNRRTRPMVCYSESCTKPFDASLGGKDKDEALCAVFREQLEAGDVSAVYLTGDIYDDSWMIESLDLIARGRKAFAGDNLYSKGAVYSALIARGMVPKAGKYVYLPEDALQWNISMPCFRKRAEIRQPLLEAGTDWYDADVSMECILAEGKELGISAASVTSGKVRRVTLPLDGLPDRPAKTTRLRLHLTMLSRETLRMHVLDLGFGEIYPSSGRRWEQEISLDNDGEQGAEPRGPVFLTVGKAAVNPYYIRLLARNIYSAEELCLSLAQCASFLDESFLDIALVSWLQEECGLGELAGTLRQLLIRKAPVNEFVAMILLYVGYQTPEEADRIRMEAAAARGMAPFGRRLGEAWFAASQGRKKEAEALMDDLLEQLPEPERDMRSEIWSRKGQLRAREFHFASAAACFKKEWEMNGRDEALVRYLAAMKFSMTGDQYRDFVGRGADLRAEEMTEPEAAKLTETLQRCDALTEEAIRSALKKGNEKEQRIRAMREQLAAGESSTFDAQSEELIRQYTDAFRAENTSSM